jgi:hypothetical protein
MVWKKIDWKGKTHLVLYITHVTQHRLVITNDNKNFVPILVIGNS